MKIEANEDMIRDALSSYLHTTYNIAIDPSQFQFSCDQTVRCTNLIAKGSAPPIKSTQLNQVLKR
jgi:hypothetical protein